MQFDSTSTRYDSPSDTLGNMDLSLHWFPVPNTLSLYGLLGMAMRKETFEVSNAFADWDNGAKSYSEFTYGYGVGARLALLNRIVLNADYRWLPGDLSMTCNDVGKLIKDYGSYGLYECDTNIETSTKNKSKLAALGMSIILGGRRAR
ncbi:MAG: porin family protein [Gemmatimonadetes bacterium]|nr:porin family protein [Gemmatimonadota bacterium]